MRSNSKNPRSDLGSRPQNDKLYLISNSPNAVRKLLLQEIKVPECLPDYIDDITIIKVETAPKLHLQPLKKTIKRTTTTLDVTKHTIMIENTPHSAGCVGGSQKSIGFTEEMAALPQKIVIAKKKMNKLMRGLTVEASPKLRKRMKTDEHISIKPTLKILLPDESTQQESLSC